MCGTTPEIPEELFTLVVPDEDEDEVWDDEGEIYDREGNVVWSHSYEGQFVDRTCSFCSRSFRGMPDHGVCNSCADTLERGGDPCGY